MGLISYLLGSDIDKEKEEIEKHIVGDDGITEREKIRQILKLNFNCIHDRLLRHFSVLYVVLGIGFFSSERYLDSLASIGLSGVARIYANKADEKRRNELLINQIYSRGQ